MQRNVHTCFEIMVLTKARTSVEDDSEYKGHQEAIKKERDYIERSVVIMIQTFSSVYLHLLLFHFL